MKKDLCTEFDNYMKKLCHTDLNISWSVRLQDGKVVYGDYERPGYDNPWFRLKEYCESNKVVPTLVKLYMFGAREHVFFSDPEGLDGLSICRGVARDQSMSGNLQSQGFQFLTVSLLDDDCEMITVKKFVWPHNEFEQAESKRLLTTKNIENMIFKHDSEKLQNPEVQKYYNGEAV